MALALLQSDEGDAIHLRGFDVFYFFFQYKCGQGLGSVVNFYVRI